MGTSSSYHGEPSPRQNPSFTTEMYNFPSPDPSYNRPSQLQEELINPAGYAPSSAIPQSSYIPKESWRLRRRRFEKLKRLRRILTGISDAVSTLFTSVMVGIVLYTIIKFTTTKDTVRDGRNPWPLHGTKLWPAIMLLVAAGLTLVASVALLVSYCCYRERVRLSWKFTVAKYAVHIAAWIVVAVLYRYEKGLNGNDNDLWGWSCSAKADEIQAAFNGVVDFHQLCELQTNCWRTSIMEFAAKMVFAIGQFIIHRKTKADKQKFAEGAGDATTGLLPDTF